MNIEKNTDNQIRKQGNVLYANIYRRFASFLIDTFATNIIFLLGLYLLLLAGNVNVVHQIYTAYTTANATTTSTHGVEAELVFAYFFVFAIYVFLMLIIWNKTLGMWAAGTRFISSSVDGTPVPLSVSQKFLRGFIGNILSFLLLFLPGIAWPFSRDKRSLLDIIAKDYAIQIDVKKSRDIACYIIITAFIIAYLYIAGI